jgi:hypothetical protein
MHLEVGVCPMVESAKTKWINLEEDERAAFNYAFADAILHAEKIADHHYYRFRSHRGIVDIHWFRIGHAVFHIAVFRNYAPIILDIAWLT